MPKYSKKVTKKKLFEPIRYFSSIKADAAPLFIQELQLQIR